MGIYGVIKIIGVSVIQAPACVSLGNEMLGNVKETYGGYKVRNVRRVVEVPNVYSILKTTKRFVIKLF